MTMIICNQDELVFVLPISWAVVITALAAEASQQKITDNWKKAFSQEKVSCLSCRHLCCSLGFFFTACKKKVCWLFSASSPSLWFVCFMPGNQKISAFFLFGVEDQVLIMGCGMENSASQESDKPAGFLSRIVLVCQLSKEGNRIFQEENESADVAAELESTDDITMSEAPEGLNQSRSAGLVFN